MNTAVRLHAADAAVTVRSDTPSVTAWSGRYFGPWWNADGGGDDDGPTVVADVDPGRYAALAGLVRSRPHQDVAYARVSTLVARDDDGAVVAASPSQRLAYRSEPGARRLTVVGAGAEQVAVAAARLARENMRGQLLRAGWSVLHASAVVRDGRAVLAFGAKGAGKTTAALLLARAGWDLLANDRVFARPAEGGVRLLPWPAAAAVGLGLLDALGWYDLARARVRAGQRLHPTQDGRVTDALLAERRTPLWDEAGKRELKAQLFPDQFTDWFGLRLSTGGHAARLLFPRVDPAAVPALAESTRTLGEGDFMSGATEDRYPDIFALTRGVGRGGGRPENRAALVRELAALPHHNVILSHHATASTDVLTGLVGLRRHG